MKVNVFSPYNYRYLYTIKYYTSKMEATFILMAVFIGVFALLNTIGYIKKGREKRITPAAIAALVLITIGIFLGDVKMIGYSMVGAGMILFVFEMIREYRKKHPQH